MINPSWLGCARAPSQKLPDRLANKIPHAEIFRSPAEGLDDPGLLHEQVVHDNLCMLPSLRADRTHFRHVHSGGLAVGFQGRHRAAQVAGTDAVNDGHDRDQLLLPGDGQEGEGRQAVRSVPARLSSSRK